MKIANLVAFVILIIGGLNWLLVGALQFDVVAELLGGTAAIISRIIYILVGISALWLTFVAIYNRSINFTKD
ncbi:MAG: DUF378 domain-containing protein [Clostridia bacterium]|nr:DUF378 domain-containing protein [Clostridia bacterium]